MKVAYSASHLNECIGNSDIASLQNFLKSGADVNILDENGEPLLFIPIVNGDMDTLKVLLAYADVNMTNEDCRTALMIAVEMNDLDIIKKLIKSGARVDCKDNSGKTAMLLALEAGHFKIAEYLIKYGSDVNAVDNLGQSALHLTATRENNECTRIVKILFNCGYVMKEADSWLCYDDFSFNQKTESKYSKLVHKLKASIKVIKGEAS
ncbi:ankyrin repeat domain-containing protein 50-like [Saccostrea cucullata]|uniref:ankyrin repeat domain-containing protein 50-like n=1 Tax=Saccostrea cuccullata TaxID=36930 RepID=UPI002ED52375